MGAWNDNTGLVRTYGPQKASPAVAGDFLSYGETREIEVTILLANLTTTAIIQDLNCYVPSSTTQTFIEKVVVETEVGMTVGSATAFSVGLGYVDPTTTTYVTVGTNTFPANTVISDTAIVNGALNATVTTAGQQNVLTTGSTGAGAYIGTASALTTQNNYITAKSVGGTYTAGQIKVRIYYRGLTPITQ